MKKGISLIVLVITILVIIVLAGAVILTVVTNNPLDKASEAVFKSDLKMFASELSVTLLEKLGNGIKQSEINADKNSEPRITEYIKSMENKTNYLDLLKIEAGELVFIGEEGQYDKELAWTQQIGIKTKAEPLTISRIEASKVTLTGMEVKVLVNKESKVAKYNLSIDNGANWIGEQANNVFTLSGLTEDTIYKMKAEITDINGKKITSNSEDIGTLWPPVVISGIEKIEAGKNNIKVSVKVDKESKVKGYKISKDDGATWSMIQDSNTFNITGLSVGTSYKIKAQVIEKNNNIVTSNTVDMKTELPDPYIPTGFEYVTGSVSTGYVIKDSKLGNEFVWIPVSDITKLVKYPNLENGDYTTTAVDVELNNTSDASAVAMKASIEKNGGFYRSRYEIGKEDGIMVSKSKIPVWNSITGKDSAPKAKSMYNTSEIGSDLIYGSQWDAICLWLKDSGYNITNSTSWGNYKNYNGASLEDGVTVGVINVTGASERWKSNNIYDMAGNVWEWSQEMTGGERYYRGGYATIATSYPVSNRSPVSDFASGTTIGFSVVLYEK